jgi:hypothetical protein
VRMMPLRLSPSNKCWLHDLRKAESAGVLPGISDEWRDWGKSRGFGAEQAED